MTAQQVLPVGRIILNLLINPSYLLCVLSMTNMMFVLTAQQYWAADYMMVVLDGDDNTVILLFALTILSAPAVGALLGGFITTKIGGYTNPRALIMCFILFLLMTAGCVPMSYVDSIYAFSVCVWFIIFTQGFIEPVFTGILLNTVSKAERATASSVSIFLMMTFGLLPAPYAYGLITDLTEVLDERTGDNLSRWGMRAISFTSVLGCISLGIALLLRKRSYRTSLTRVKSAIRHTYRHLSEEKVEEIIKEVDEEEEIDDDAPKNTPRAKSMPN